MKRCQPQRCNRILIPEFWFGGRSSGPARGCLAHRLQSLLDATEDPMEGCAEVGAPFEAIEVNQPAQMGLLLSSCRLRSMALALAQSHQLL
jgi:hypothetical protein